MASIWSKVALIVQGNVHTVLDAAIDRNAPAAVEQQIRNLKQARQTVDEALTRAIANGRGHSTERAQLLTRIGQLEVVINEILTNDNPNDDAAAIPKQAEQDRANVRVAQLDGLIESAGAEQGALTEALAAFNTRIAEWEHQLQVLRTTDSGARAKEEAARALTAASEMLSRGPGSSVDNALARAQQRAGVAAVGLERAVEGVRATTGMSDAEVLATARIRERKAKLAAANSEAAA